MRVERVLLVIFLCGRSIVLSALESNPPAGPSKLEEAERIWKELPTFPNAAPTCDATRSLAWDASVMAQFFKTKASFEELKSFYSPKLANAGWTFVLVDRIFERSEPVGMILAWERGGARLILRWVTEKSRYGWEYSVVLALEAESHK